MRGQKPPDPAYPDQLRTLGDHIRKRRLDLGLLQRQVAAELGVTASSVNNWERNRTRPALRFVPRVIEFLGDKPLLSGAHAVGEQIALTERNSIPPSGWLSPPESVNRSS